jgi:hypothetical protein
MTNSPSKRTDWFPRVSLAQWWEGTQLNVNKFSWTWELPLNRVGQTRQKSLLRLWLNLWDDPFWFLADIRFLSYLREIMKVSFETLNTSYGCDDRFLQQRFFSAYFLNNTQQWNYSLPCPSTSCWKIVYIYIYIYIYIYAYIYIHIYICVCVCVYYCDFFHYIILPVTYMCMFYTWVGDIKIPISIYGLSEWLSTGGKTSPCILSLYPLSLGRT